MNSPWPLVVVTLAVLLVGYCAYSAHETSRSVDRALDQTQDLIAQHDCYKAGYEIGYAGEKAATAPDGEADCQHWYGLGYADGRKLYDGLTP